MLDYYEDCRRHINPEFVYSYTLSAQVCILCVLEGIFHPKVIKEIQAQYPKIIENLKK